ncbi:hypothetical protein H4R33_000216 [Dimargaris cristalligena]|uniref:Trypsin-like cysteine/serine peptidase domain-containing protein n=1 Tax=Dimargaris cristalligena TaxID=215637 RepID=A0A4P9ZZ05_9FUNG|nr:hypothetical protein H4R33_000216 [Dimargaris cristalligena]RKP38618.1 trypsin-like cysteine/serine peptidase domain-containing protein [Dimargaris cristalligena]|eukprot:RKP38618.1 trypsin-like cysteine/serine peptidase domain-containing protein [Dimargaris cristalligena]
MYLAEGRSQHCGSSIIDASWLLTAAHCVTETLDSVPTGSDSPRFTTQAADKYVVSAGNVITTQGDYKTIQKIIVHTKYNSTGSADNDIALLQLSSPLVLSDNVKPIRIYRGNLTEGDAVVAAGMGRTTVATDDGSTTLKQVNLPIAKTTDCQNIIPGYKDSNGPQVCAGGQENRDTCSGDSGGPLYWLHSDKTPALVGCTSYGMGPKDDSPICGAKQGVGVYTHASYFLDWIVQESGLNSQTISFEPVVTTGKQLVQRLNLAKRLF